MKGKRQSEEQIVQVLGEAGSGHSVAQTARDYGVSETTIAPAPEGVLGVWIFQKWDA